MASGLVGSTAGFGGERLVAGFYASTPCFENKLDKHNPHAKIAANWEKRRMSDSRIVQPTFATTQCLATNQSRVDASIEWRKRVTRTEVPVYPSRKHHRRTSSHRYTHLTLLFPRPERVQHNLLCAPGVSPV